MPENWPKYYNKMILQPSPSGEVGIICGWTKKESIEASLSDEARARVAAVGQLYSREGANFIIRNAFLNPNLKYLVLTGLDLSGSLRFFRDFLSGKDLAEDILHREIPKDKARQFCQWFSEHVRFAKEEELSEAIVGLDRETPQWIATPEEFPEPAYQEACNFTSEEAAIRLEDGKVADLWLKVLDRILKFGRDKMSQYGEMQRELVSLITVVSEEDPDDPHLPDYLTFGKADLENYFRQMMTAEVPEKLEYTYGSRLRDHDGVNQIESIIAQLKEEDYTRRAVAVTWNVAKDDRNPKAPCLDLIQALVNQNKLYLTCYFRSNDMYGAWPQNAIALRAIQKEIARAAGKEMGKLIVVSNSAHIYEHDYEKAVEAVKNHKPALECRQDPRGSFVISIKEGKIGAVHMTPNGRAVQSFCGASAEEVANQIYPFVSETLHALDLGAELQKAEIALKKGLQYSQDNLLQF